VRQSTWFKQRKDMEDSGADKTRPTIAREEDWGTWKLQKSTSNPTKA
jgi:hypothetical protein